MKLMDQILNYLQSQRDIYFFDQSLYAVNILSSLLTQKDI